MLAFVLMLSQEPATTPRPEPPAAAEPVATAHHRILLAGRPFSYTVTAGRLPILDNETGEARAWMFFVAYTADGGRADRPLTFAWNGGPGSNAGLIQLGGLGPKRYGPGNALVDNQETWLDRTDLVFVDPVGTGYSRVTRKEYGPTFYQTRGDAASVAEFIRVYRDRYGRWDAPLYLTGESFGVTRAASVAEALVRRRIPVRGVVLIGLTAPLDRVPAPVRTALQLTNYAAAAWHHRRLEGAGPGGLAAAVAAAERFALDTLAPALARGGADRTALARAAAVYAGLTPELGDSAEPVPSYPRFARRLLADRHLRLGHYDSRTTGPMDRPDQPYDPTADPSLQGPPPPNGIPRYLRAETGYRSDLQYTGPFGGSYPPPAAFRGDWMSMRWQWQPGEVADSGAGPAEDLPLRQAMALDPNLRVVAVCGWYDLVCVPAVNAWIRTRLPSDLRARVAAEAVAGGHAVYLDRGARSALKTAVFRFFGAGDDR